MMLDSSYTDYKCWYCNRMLSIPHGKCLWTSNLTKSNPAV